MSVNGRVACELVRLAINYSHKRKMNRAKLIDWNGHNCIAISPHPKPKLIAISFICPIDSVLFKHIAVWCCNLYVVIFKMVKWFFFPFHTWLSVYKLPIRFRWFIISYLCIHICINLMIRPFDNRSTTFFAHPMWTNIQRMLLRLLHTFSHNNYKHEWLSIRRFGDCVPFFSTSFQLTESFMLAMRTKTVTKPHKNSNCKFKAWNVVWKVCAIPNLLAFDRLFKIIVRYLMRITH